MNHWIGVVSREHVQRGVAESMAQMGHGKKAPLQRMKAGDWIAYYSPRVAYPDGAPLQAFTAIGRVRTGEVYAFDMGGGFVPWRIDIDWLPCREAPIRPLIASLEFISDKTHWGAAFRYGQVKVGEADFARIREAMGVAPAA